MHPQKTPARLSFDQVTVSAMGMTAGLSTTPLGKNKTCSRETQGVGKNSDVLDVEEPPEVDARFVQLRRGSSIVAFA